jgi:hypothetical protein
MMAAVPTWLCRAVSVLQSLANKNVDDMALVAGTAIGALDTVSRRQERWAGAWRQRLALAAAAVTARQVGRVDDEAAPRDAVLPTKASTEVGPAGLLLLAWRRLAPRSAENLLTKKNLAPVFEAFGYEPDDETVGELADELRQLARRRGLQHRS